MLPDPGGDPSRRFSIVMPVFNEMPTIQALRDRVRKAPTLYAFRVSDMGTLTPRDMERVVAAFAAVLEEPGVVAAGSRR